MNIILKSKHYHIMKRNQSLYATHTYGSRSYYMQCNSLLMLHHLITIYWIDAMKTSPLDYMLSLFLTCMSHFVVLSPRVGGMTCLWEALPQHDHSSTYPLRNQCMPLFVLIGCYLLNNSKCVLYIILKVQNHIILAKKYNI